MPDTELLGKKLYVILYEAQAQPEGQVVGSVLGHVATSLGTSLVRSCAKRGGGGGMQGGVACKIKQCYWRVSAPAHWAQQRFPLGQRGYSRSQTW